MPRASYVSEDELPRLQSPRGAGVLRAMELLRGAIASKKALRLEFAVDERSNSTFYHYTRAAQQLGVKVRCKASGYREYTTLTGSTDKEPAVIYVVIQETPGLTALAAPTARISSGGWSGDRPAHPEPERAVRP